jgi:hypothetical protein
LNEADVKDFKQLNCFLAFLVWLRQVGKLLAWKIEPPFVFEKISPNCVPSEFNQVVHLKEPQAAPSCPSCTVTTQRLSGLIATATTRFLWPRTTPDSELHGLHQHVDDSETRRSRIGKGS